MSKACRGRNLIGLFFLPALTALLAFTSAAAFAEPVREAPAVSSITVVSSPARGDIYELGEIIKVAVEFDIAVTATGSPHMALTIGSHTRKATLSRLDGQSLYFAYDVHEEDLDDDGISIAANALILDGGTITADDGTVDADLAHAAVAAEHGSKVNGSLFSPPAVTSISFRSSPARDDTYELGERISVLVEFDRVVTATGEAQIALTIGTMTRHATAYGWGSHASLHFSYTVQEADRDEDGISIPANALSLRGTFKGPDGTTDADLTHVAVAAEDASKVNGSLASPPAVKHIYFVSSPARDDTYERGEKIEVLVEFDRMVTATGTVRMALTIGEETRQATSPGSSWGSSSALFLDYTVQEGDRDEDGISVPANALSLDGATIKGPDGTTDADLTHEEVAAHGSRTVDGSLLSPPRVKRLYFLSSPARDHTYELGETVEVLVEFDKAVKVTGSPQLALSIGAETRPAAYSRWWGDDREAQFSYTVQEGDRDEDGISIPANALSLNGGTITADDGTTDADLTHEEVAPERDKKVDGRSDVPPPRVTGISIDSSPAQGDTYQRGETIEVEFEFDSAVKFTGEPRLALTIGTRTRHATGYGWGHSMTFRYTVKAGDRDEDGISISANALSLNGGTIKAADGVTDALLTHEAMAPDGDSKVDGSEVTPPRVRNISISYPPARGDTYELGETVEVEVEFDRVVAATGQPQVALTVGTETRYAGFSGWGDERLYFEYTVQEGDRDEDGISIPANALSLNGGTIKAADGTTDAELAHGAVGAYGGRKMDGSAVTAPAVRHLYLSYSPARGDTFERGETIEVTVEFDRSVTVTGSPRIALTIGAETRHAAFSTAWGDDRHADFSYVVQEGDRDEDGISIPANALALNGGAITAADGSTDADLTHPAVAPDRDRKVDGSGDVTPPRVTGISFDSAPSRGETYELGETVEVVVHFDGAVKASGNPQLALTIGTEIRHATWFGWSSSSLYFQYTVQEGDRDEDGISIAPNAFSLSGGSITAADGTTDADLTHPAVAAERGSKVDASLITPPLAIDVHFISSPARGDTYERGETVEVLVEFDKEVTVTGSLRVALTIGSETRHAHTISGEWGSSPVLLFEYTVQEGDRDEDGISIAANALALNGGTITAADGITDADLTHGAVDAGRGGKVNGSLTTPPRVRDIYFVSSPARGDTYELGETIEVVVVFGKGVTVTGTPRVGLTVGAHTRQAAYSHSWDDRHARFSYAVQEADRDEDGISIPANALALNGATIMAAGGTAEADLAHDAVAADAALKVNGSLVTPPAVRAIYLDNHVPPPSGDTYVRGERVRVWVEFDRDVMVTGRPRVALAIGSQTRQATFSGHSTMVAPDGGTIIDENVLSFDYVVQATDRDEDGVGIPANALALNGGTITAANGLTDADLGHDEVAADPTRKVNGSRSTL